MEYILLSLFAGILTVASPCVLPLLPVVLASSAAEKSRRTPIIIIASLSISIVVFTLLLKVSTVFIGVDETFWLKLSGLLILAVGLSMLFPKVWDYISLKLKFIEKSHELQNKSLEKKGILRNILLGVSLGPIFSSCSPTYGIILGTVLPNSFAVGLLNLIVFALGLAIVLFAIAFGGQWVLKRLTWASKSDGWFRKFVGIFLVLIGILIATGLIRDLEIWWASSDFNFIGFEVDQVKKIQGS
jgi:cytochrome c biogenesis protein CcdA